MADGVVVCDSFNRLTEFANKINAFEAQSGPTAPNRHTHTFIAYNNSHSQADTDRFPLTQTYGIHSISQAHTCIQTIPFVSDGNNINNSNDESDARPISTESTVNSKHTVRSLHHVHDLSPSNIFLFFFCFVINSELRWAPIAKTQHTSDSRHDFRVTFFVVARERQINWNFPKTKCLREFMIDGTECAPFLSFYFFLVFRSVTLLGLFAQMNDRIPILFAARSTFTKTNFSSSRRIFQFIYFFVMCDNSARNND